MFRKPWYRLKKKCIRSFSFDDKPIFLLKVLLIALPWLVLYSFVMFYAHDLPQNISPTLSDELSYWQQVNAFNTRWFDFGYFAYDEKLPSFLSFGAWGIGPIFCYTVYAKIFGWSFSSMVFANAFFMSLALFLLILLVECNRKTILAIIISYVLYSPLVLYTAMSMTELLNYALLIVYIALLYRFLKQPNKQWSITLLVFVSCMCFVRSFYVLLFLPVLFKRESFKSVPKLVLLFIAWLCLSGLIYFVSGLFCSPYPNKLFLMLHAKDVSTFFELFIKNIGENVLQFISFKSDDLMQSSFSYCFMFLMLVFIFKSNLFSFKVSRFNASYIVVSTMLFLHFLIVIFFYEVVCFRGYRTLSPVLFSSVLYLVISKERIAVIVSLVSFAVVFVMVFFYSDFSVFYCSERYNLQKCPQLESMVVYTPNATDKFENSMLIDGFYKHDILSVPAGIGLIYLFDQPCDTMKSKYLFAKRKHNELQSYAIIDSTCNGYLYQKRILHKNYELLERSKN